MGKETRECKDGAMNALLETWERVGRGGCLGEEGDYKEREGGCIRSRGGTRGLR